MTGPTRMLSVALTLLALAGCKREDMYTQASSRSYDHNSFFRDGSTMRIPVAGTVARGEPDQPVPQPGRIDAAMLDRGQQRFGIFCAPCHGAAGDGRGMVVQRGMVRPPSFHIARLRAAPAQHFYDVITNGQDTMYSYAARVSPQDRWAVIAYIRALQLSQDADPAALPAEDRRKLEAAR